VATILELQALTVNYGGIQAVKGIDMSIQEGHIIAVLGANGAGKTSTLRAISGIVPVASGKVIVGGADLTNKPPYVIAAAGVGQSPEGRLVLPSLTTEENLKVGATLLKNKKDVAQTFEQVYELFPILKERRTQQATTLSGGEQQMLAIGRALMMKPKVLLLDEPSLGLAPLIIKDIFAAIKQIANEGVTVLMVEQNARQSLLIADYAYVMELGNIKMHGVAKDLLDDENLISAYLGKH